MRQLYIKEINFIREPTLDNNSLGIATQHIPLSNGPPNYFSFIPTELKRLNNLINKPLACYWGNEPITHTNI